MRVTAGEAGAGLCSACLAFDLLINDIYFGIMSSTRRTPSRAMKTSPPTLDPETLRRAADRAVGTLKLLANVERMLLLCQLSQGEMCVSDLAMQLGIRQPTLSQQLGVLRNEGVVGTRRDGKNIFYSVADPDLLEILAVLYRLYCPKEK